MALPWSARLLRSATDLGVELRTSSPAVRLLDEGGSVCGAVLAHAEGRAWKCCARRGVVLAAGGFPHDPARRQRHVPRRRGAPDRSRPLAPPATACASASPWAARWTTRWPHPAPGARCRWCRSPTARSAASRTSSSATSPGIIGVLADGRRFCNEGNGYHDYVAAMLRAVPPGQEVASWLVCTRAFQRRYGLGIARPTPLPVGPYIRSGYLKTGRTIAELGPELRDRSGGAGADGGRLQCARPPGRGPRVRTWQHPLQSPERRSGQHAQSVRGADRARAVLRGEGGAGQLRHLRRD